MGFFSRLSKKDDLALPSFAPSAPPLSGLVAETRYGKFYVPFDDEFVCKELRSAGREGHYNEKELLLAKNFVSPGSSTLVVGAHVGAFAIPLAGWCHSVIAIEANPRIFRYLENNIERNKLFNIVAHNLAAWDKHEKIEFLLNTVNSGGSKANPVKMDSRYNYDNPKSVKVPSAPLDDIVKERSFDLILMDIEGSEHRALKGMQNILRGTKALSVEFLPHHLDNVAAVSVDEFLEPILPHFNWLYVPQHDRLVTASAIPAQIHAFYDANESHDGLYFLKDPLPNWLAASRLSPG